MKKSDEKRLNAAIRTAVSRIKPPERLTVSEWADKKRRLSEESSAETGRWRTSRTPYLKEPMDAFTDPRVRHIVIVSSSQVGKSETMNNIAGYIIDQDPGSILFIHPTTIDAKEYSKLRIAPMIRDSPSLRKKVADPKSRDSANTILQKTYPGGILTMCGSAEAHSLASKPIRYVLGDERDRWAESAGDEGDPWGLALARQITFYNAKSVEVSTPTVKGHSAIEKAYANGTRERWCTKCPHCGEYTEITFDNIRFEYDEIKAGDDVTYDVTDVFYLCPKCGAASTEAVMKKQPSKWIAENPDALAAIGKRSFWLSSWVSPWASWESTIVQFLEARGNSKKMQVVYNTRFGWLWEDRGDLEDEESVMSRRERYEAELPDGALYLTCGVDTQDDRFEYEVVGHGHFGETWGIRKGVILGRPDTEEAWAALEEVIQKKYAFRDGAQLPVSMTFIDEGGHFTQDVRLQCRKRSAMNIYPVKGRGGPDVPYTSPPKKQKIVIDGKMVGTCYVFGIGVDAGKQIIMDNLKVQTPGKGYTHFPLRDDYGPAYFKSLISERLVYKEGLRSPWRWEKIPGHERNEALDCRNYAIAACKSMSPDFDLLEQRLRETRSGEPAKAEEPAPRRAKKPRKQIYNDW